MTKILGVDSAHAKAKEMPYCSNMTISAALVIDMFNRIAELEKEKGLMLHEVAKQYDGNDLTEWSNGANHVFKLFTKWIYSNAIKETK